MTTLILILILLAVSFVFSGIEAGILSVNRVRLADRVKRKDPAALKLEQILANPDQILITVLLVTNLANIFALVLGAGALVDALGRRGYLVALAIYLPLYLFGLELLPKSLFRRFPYRALAALAEPLRLLDLILTPVHWIGFGAQRLLFGERTPQSQRLILRKEDFKFMTLEGERTGTLTKTEREMILNVVDFRGVTAGDVMEPILPSQVVRGSEPVSRFIAEEAKHGVGKWFVSDTEGNISGVVDAFEVLLEGRRDVDVATYQRRVVFVGPKEPAFSVLRKLRAARISVAAVRGSEARPIGRVTWEELVKRIVQAADRREPAS